MELKKVLESFGLTVVDLDNLSDEDLQKMIDEKVNQDKEHITQLESEKKTLSEEKEALTTSEAGYKAREENLTKELDETKTKLVSAESKLEQITSMYKEQFTKDPNEQPVIKTESKIDSFDIMQALIGSK